MIYCKTSSSVYIKMQIYTELYIILHFNNKLFT